MVIDKVCLKCKEKKDISQFKYNSGSLDKHSKNCKLCLSKGRVIIKGIKIWNEQKIKDGFVKFYKENGHYPTAPEIDKCSYLPSSREIQRTYGGIVRIRTRMGLTEEEIDHSKGINRSNLGKVSGIVSLASEKTIQDLLTNLYGEICVHEQKNMVKVKTLLISLYMEKHVILE